MDADDELYRRYLAAPPFHHNRPNKEWDHERLLDFFERVFNAPPNPVTRRRWFWPLIKWRLVKRIKTSEEKGLPTAEQRHAEWLRESGKTPSA